MDNAHIPVLLEECISNLDCKKDGVYVDATLGNAGHARAILERYPDIALLVGLDQDQEALERARNNLEPFPKQTLLLHGNFYDLKKILAHARIAHIDGILFDLGVSSAQLNDPSRGFSFQQEGALDMRMNKAAAITAKDLLERITTRELEEMLRNYGEERWAKKIAAFITRRLESGPIESTTELAALAAQAIPARYHPKNIHPATRTFQALRIAVNDELHAVEHGLDDAMQLLNPGGRLCVISFHSLEDRIVKKRFKQWQSSCSCPPGLPQCICNTRPQLKVLTRKPLVPAEQECRHNPRARSAKLRVGQRI